ncbi:MAG: A24 family peptidase [bacterium]|nr:A24 family peptidase [bacterium]
MDNGVLWVLAFLIFLLIWTIDYRLYLIPDELNISLAVLGFLKIISDSFYKQFSGFQGSFLGGYADLFGFRNNIWINHFWAALAGVLIVGLIIFITKGRGMGFGDLKLMSALGFLYGWPDILFIFVFASLIGSVISLFLVILKRKNFKSTVPFGPFLVLGAITIFFFGEKILSAYFNFLSSF